MLNYMTRICLFLALAMISGISRAQDFSNGEKAEMADTFRNNGKIYVVVAVVLLILAGLILYLVSIDRKITRMEKEKS